MTTATPPAAPTDYAAPTTPKPGVPLHRMPLVWVAVLVPAAFVVFLTLLTPSL
jgi:hypothetical protein